MKQDRICKSKELNGKECDGVLIEDIKEIKKYFSYLLKEGKPLLCPKCGLVHREDGSLWIESIMGACDRIPNVKLAKKWTTVKRAINALMVLESFLEENFKDTTVSIFEKNSTELYWHQNVLLFREQNEFWRRIYTDDDFRKVVNKFGLRKSHIEKRQRSLM